MKNKADWQQAQANFIAWWNRSVLPRPLLWIVARRDEPLAVPASVAAPLDPEDLHLNVERQVRILRNHGLTHRYLAEAFPYLNINIGPGSLATYLGTEPVLPGIRSGTRNVPRLRTTWETWPMIRTTSGGTGTLT